MNNPELNIGINKNGCYGSRFFSLTFSRCLYAY